MVLIKWCQPSLKQMSKLKYPMQRNLLKTISTCSSVLNSDGMAKTYCQRHNLLKYQRNHSSWIQPEGFDTNINVYNSLTKQKDKLILQRKNVATWYVCGPTVYDSAHLGHARTNVQFDIIRRILTNIFEIDIIQVLNITDIDDKIIAKAAKKGISMTEVSRKYEHEFFNDMAALNVLPPTLVPHVTDNIDTIIQYIDRIMKKRCAYATPSGSVYFNVPASPHYGKLHSKESPTTESIDSEKQNPLDFVLWKAAKPGEPFWESPWGKGRPGWHIECSAMASKIFGDKIDIHSGGEDLIFPHHENEIAQSEAHYGCDQWVNYWLHTGHLYLSQQNEKMSKSLQNVILISDFLKSYTSDQFRMLCMLTHYRNRMAYQDNVLVAVTSLLQQVESYLQNSEAYIKGHLKCKSISEAEVFSRLEKTKTEVKIALADDFNTPKAMKNILELVQFLNSQLSTSQENIICSRSPVSVSAASLYIKNIFKILGINLGQQENSLESSFLQHQMSCVLDSSLKFRNEVRQFIFDPPKDLSFGTDYEKLTTKEQKKKKFQIFQPLLKSSDNLRKEFSSANIQVMDYENSSSWKIISHKIK